MIECFTYKWYFYGTASSQKAEKATPRAPHTKQPGEEGPTKCSSSSASSSSSFPFRFSHLDVTMANSLLPKIENILSLNVTVWYRNRPSQDRNHQGQNKHTQGLRSKRYQPQPCCDSNSKVHFNFLKPDHEVSCLPFGEPWTRLSFLLWWPSVATVPSSAAKTCSFFGGVPGLPQFVRTAWCGQIDTEISHIPELLRMFSALQIVYIQHLT